MSFELSTARGSLGFRLRKLLVLFSIACLLGLGISVELTRIHVFSHTDPSFHSVCAVSEDVNCETVALSLYSVFAGLPVSVWGIMGYLLMGFIGICCLNSLSLLPPLFCGALITTTTISLLSSFYLSMISLTKIDSICLFCMASYGINAFLFVLSILILRLSSAGVMGWVRPSIKSILENLPLTLLSLVIASSVIGFTLAAVPPYWQISTWNDLPELHQGKDEQGHHYIGAQNPLVSVVEFSDYECPHCRTAHKKIRMLAAEFPNRVRLYHRHLPLDRSCHPKMNRDFHRHACHFAMAAECSGEQGKFWQMNDALFSIQDDTKSADVDVERLAVKIGLDRSSFKECMSTKRVESRIISDLEVAIQRGIRGTPTFFVGKRRYSGSVPRSVMKKLVETESNNEN